VRVALCPCCEVNRCWEQCPTCYAPLEAVRSVELPDREWRRSAGLAFPQGQAALLGR